MSVRPVVLRDAGLSDVGSMARIERDAAHAPWTEAALTQSLQSPTTFGLLVTAGPDEGLAGHVLASAVADEGEILTVAVLPIWRRAGLATALMQAAEARWRTLGVTTGWLEVRADNDAALALYDQLGWRQEGRRRAYYDDGMDAVVMRRPLQD